MRCRAIGEATWHDAAFDRSRAGGWYASLPARAPPGVEYYIRGTDAAGVEVDSLRVGAVAARRARRSDRSSTASRSSTARASTASQRDLASTSSAHDFGNRYDLPDDFLRGEVIYTHRAAAPAPRGRLRLRHDRGQDADRVDRRARIDPATARATASARSASASIRRCSSMRASPSASARTASIGGMRGQLTFGKPWRSCVSGRRRVHRRPRADGLGPPAVGHRAAAADGRIDRPHRSCPAR